MRNERKPPMPELLDDADLDAYWDAKEAAAMREAKRRREIDNSGRWIWWPVGISALLLGIVLIRLWW